MSKHPIDILKERGVIDSLAGDMSPEEVEVAVSVSRKIIDAYIDAFSTVQKGLKDPAVRAKVNQYFSTHETFEDKIDELIKEGELVEDSEESDDV